MDFFRWEYVVENELIYFYNESVQNYHESLKIFLDHERVPNVKEMNNFLRKLRDETLETFSECLKFKTKALERKYNEYKNKIIEFMNEKEELALNLNGEGENQEEYKRIID